jgi:hypothetical protein
VDGLAAAFAVAGLFLGITQETMNAIQVNATQRRG